MTWGNSIKALFWIVSIGALLFLAAGTLDWPNAWIFMAEFVIGGLAVTLWLAWRDPDYSKSAWADRSRRAKRSGTRYSWRLSSSSGLAGSF